MFTAGHCRDRAEVPDADQTDGPKGRTSSRLLAVDSETTVVVLPSAPSAPDAVWRGVRGRSGELACQPLRAASGPVMRLSRGRVEAMMPSEVTRPRAMSA